MIGGMKNERKENEMRKWACRREGNCGIEGAVKGTKEEVLEWMKCHFDGLRPCEEQGRVVPAWFKWYKGEAMRFETAHGDEVYLVEDIGGDHKEEALAVLGEMNEFLESHSLKGAFKEGENGRHLSLFNDKIRALGWVALFDNKKMYKKEDGLHMQVKLVDPDSEEVVRLP